MTINKMILIGTVLLMTLALISPIGFGVASPQAFVQPVFHIGFGDAAYASFISLDFPVQGADNHDVQFQNALDSLPEAYGGQIYVWWGDYQFSSQVARDIDNVIWQGVGAATHIDYNGVTPCITAGAQSNWLFRNISVDAGDVTDDDVLVDDSDSNYRIEMWVDGVWTHDIGGTGEGSGNCTQEEVEDYAGNMVSGGTETRIVVTYDDAAGMFNFVVDDMNDDVPESGDFGAAADLDADGSITSGVIDEIDLDIVNAAVDEYVLSYEVDTGNFEWKDASAAGDSVSIDGVGVVDPDFVSTGDIDFVDTVNTITADINPSTVGSTEITNDSIAEIDLHIDNAPTDEHVLTYESDTGNLAWQEGVGDDMGAVNTETELEDALDDVTDVFTNNDGTLWTQEQIEDFTGDMVAGNTETRITVTYEDGDSTIDFVVDDDFLLNDGDTGTGNYDFTGAFFLGAWPFYFEGVTANDIWTRFAFTDPTGNNTITFPDASGEVSLLGQTIETGEITNDTILEIDLDATNEAADNQVLSFDNGTGGFTWVEDTGSRSVTLVVAANDTSDAGKASADYVCDAVDDHVQVQAALDALTADGGEVRLLEGTYNIESTINLDSYQTLSGCGSSTILTTASGIEILSAVGGSGTEKIDIAISNLSIDGAGVATYCVYFEYVNTSRVINCWLSDNVETAVYLENSDSNLISENDIDGNSTSLDLIWLYNSSEHNVVSDNNCYNAGAGYGGIVLSFNSNSNTVTSNASHDNSYGIEVYTEDNSIFSNVCENNDTYGISLSSANYATIVGNDCRGNGEGVHFLNSNYVLLSSNNCHLNDDYGIYIIASDHNSISSNTCTENSQSANNTFDGIYIYNSDYCYIANNFCRVGTETNGQRYGINVAHSTCDNTAILGNDVYDSGETANINDAGTGTIIRNNRGHDSDWGDVEEVSDSVLVQWENAVDLDAVGNVTDDSHNHTGATITHDPVLRYMPEIFACSMNGNTSSSIGGCESVDFGGIELSVVEYTAGNSTAFFHLKMPIEFGYGGNTTITVSYGIRVEDGSSGTSLIMSTLIGTTIADAIAEGWHNSTAMAWTANDEIYWTANLVIDESLSEGAQDLYFGVNLISEDWDATDIFVDKALFQAWGI